jgi:amidohydrolase
MIDPPTDVAAAIDHWLDEHGDGLIALRRSLHAHPERSGEELATTNLVQERLELAGLEPRRLTSGTGLICDLFPASHDFPPGHDVDFRGGLALRADLDALAMADEKDVTYRSQVEGVSHACGHDVHTSIVLGTALYFAQHPEQLGGPLRFIFQPAEERVPGGALDVLTDGGLDGVAAIVGLHCEPKLDVGTIGLKPGAISSAADMAVITLSGPGGHTARPELTVDLITVAARVVAELPGRVAERVADLDAHEGATDPAVKVVFGSIHAGDAANVIPTHCTIKASIRTPSLPVWDALPLAFEHELRALVDGTGATLEVEYTHGVPPVVNDGEVTRLVGDAAAQAFGDEAVAPVQQSWGGDDFAWFTREVPGTYVRLGVRTPHGPTLDLHAGHFDVDERAIAIGVRLLAATVDRYFSSESPPAPGR